MPTVQLKTSDPPVVLLSIDDPDPIVATDPSCCCGCQCALPDAECPHALCFEFNPATQELVDGYYDTGYLAALNDSSNNNDIIRPYAYIYDAGENYVAGFAAASSIAPGPQVEVPMTLEDFFDNWHCISVKINRVDEDTLNVEVSAYGATDSLAITLDDPTERAAARPDRFFAGSQEAFPGPVDVQIKSISLLANPDADPTEIDFSFNADSFDETIGSGQSTSGDIVHVVCSDGLTNGYFKNLDPRYDLRCVPCDCCLANRIQITSAVITATRNCEGTSECPCDQDPPEFTITSDTLSGTATDECNEAHIALDGDTDFTCSCPTDSPNSASHIEITVNGDGMGGCQITVAGWIDILNCGVTSFWRMGLDHVTGSMSCDDIFGEHAIDFSGTTGSGDDVSISLTFIIT